MPSIDDFNTAFNLASKDWKGLYNTPVPPEKQASFEQWKAQTGHQRDDWAYDIGGYFMKYGDKPTGSHLTDEFKKPNHPSFSTESVYHDSEGMQGGAWEQDSEKKWHFNASPHNIAIHGGVEGIKKYFKTYDPESILHLPGE